MVKKISVSQRANVISIILALLFIINFAIMYRVVALQKSEQQLLNIAIKQKMLTQKMSKEASLLVQNYTSPRAERLVATIKEFKQNLNNLLNDQTKNKLKAVKADKIMQQLKETKQIWDENKEQLKQITVADLTQQQREKLLPQITKSNTLLLKNINQVVDAYSQNSSLDKILLMQSIILAVGLLVVVLFRIGINKFLVNPLLEISDIIAKIADGNLTLDLDVDQENEVGKIKKNLKRMINNFQDIIQELIEVSEQLVDYGEKLSASAQEGNATIETTNDLIADISASIQEISASTQEVSSFAEESSSRAERGNQNIENTLTSINNINNSTAEAVTIIEELDEVSEEINTVVELITDIAEQTNLLALNASIEAARASSEEGVRKQAGQGFGVVAEEIRELAEETNEATEKISQLITRTQKKADQGLAAVDEVQDRATEGEKVAAQTKEVFQEINSSSEQTATQIEQIANATQNLAEKSEQVQTSAQEIQTMSDQVTESSQKLESMAQELDEIVTHFSI